MKRYVRLDLLPEKTQLIIDALMSSKGDRPATREEVDLARRVTDELRQHQRQWAKDDEAADELAKYRAHRAENAVLTERQAVCLAAIRAGKGPFNQIMKYTTAWSWRHARSMGGAVSRMVETLIEEGLITKRRELTEGGLARLVEYENKHPTFKAGIASAR